MKKVKNGFENQCSDEESGLKNRTTKTESHPGNEK
jgi:hypothetical protein